MKVDDLKKKSVEELKILGFDTMDELQSHNMESNRLGQILQLIKQIVMEKEKKEKDKKEKK